MLNDIKRNLIFIMLLTKRIKFTLQPKQIHCCWAHILPKPAPSVPIIQCKRPEFNFYEDSKPNTKLASKAWEHRKSNGDYFTIYPRNRKRTLTSGYAEDITFEKLGIWAELTQILQKESIVTPTSIQSKAIPYLLTGRNSIISSQTGSGKTLAYLLPLLQRLLALKPHFKDRPLNTPLAVILLPGRELAEQITEVVSKFTELGIQSNVIIGGQTKRMMMSPEFNECDLVIATLGAISKLTTTGIYRMGQCSHLVLDEADTLLDDSFNDKLRYFLKHFRLQYGGFDSERCEGTQLTLTSATIPTNIYTALENIIPTDSLQHLTVNAHQVLTHVPQKFLRISRSDKAFELLRLVKESTAKKEPVIIFSNKSVTSDWVSLFLNSNSVSCINLNGDMPHKIRMGVFKQFQDDLYDVISCTDIGSRGLNTVKAKHVINFDFPLHTADYIHRVGRVGRIGSPDGCFVTNLVCGGREVEIVRKIEEAVRKGEPIGDVNGNITQELTKKVLRSIRSDISNIGRL